MTLSVDNIAFGYASRALIKDITFQVQQNEILAIMGPNGVGKTTLLKCLHHILTPQRGTVFIGDENMRKMHRKERARQMGYVVQNGERSQITVYDLLLLGRKVYFTWVPSEYDHQVVSSTLALLGLSHLALRSVHTVSGGEFQMVQIARALVQEPRVLLLDEPTSNLDLANQHRVLSLVEHIVKLRPIVAVMTSHDINLSIRYADRFVFMRDGLIYASGGKEVITAEIISAVYGINVHIGYINGIPFVVPA